MGLLLQRLQLLPETFADIGNAAERCLVHRREVVFAFGAWRGRLAERLEGTLATW